MNLRTAFLWVWIFAAEACSPTPSSTPETGSTSAAASHVGSRATGTAFEAKVDTTPQLNARMEAYKGPLQKFMHACLFQEEKTNAFVTVLLQAVSGSNGTCEDAVEKLQVQPILTRELTNKGLTEISLLQEFTFLTQLNLSGNAISVISPLANLTQLTLLDISNNAVSDITAVAGLSKLTELDILGNKIQDVSSLSSLTELTILRMNRNYISKIDAVKSLSGLIELDVAQNGIQVLTPLATLTSLQRLYLDQNHVLDVSALTNLTQLQELTLSQAESTPSTPSRSTDTDTDTDTETTTVTPIYKINSIAPLRALTQLQKLTVRNNNIQDTSAVSGMSKLVTLDLSNNSITSIAFVSQNSAKTACTCTLPALKKLDISGNQFADMAMLNVCATSLKMNFIYSPQGAPRG